MIESYKNLSMQLRYSLQYVLENIYCPVVLQRTFPLQIVYRIFLIKSLPEHDYPFEIVAPIEIPIVRPLSTENNSMRNKRKMCSGDFLTMRRIIFIKEKENLKTKRIFDNIIVSAKIKIQSIYAQLYGKDGMSAYLEKIT